MKLKKSPVKLTGDADKGLRKLRKDAGTFCRWAKRKYKFRKAKKQKMKGKDLKK